MKKKICFFSFLLPFLSMMAIFIGNGIYPFGDQSFMHSDMYHQYVPFLEDLSGKCATANRSTTPGASVWAPITCRFTATTAQAHSTG